MGGGVSDFFGSVQLSKWFVLLTSDQRFQVWRQLMTVLCFIATSLSLSPFYYLDMMYIILIGM